MRLADSSNRIAAAFVAPLTCKSQRDGQAAFLLRGVECYG
jgi:hypothetical protein